MTIDRVGRLIVAILCHSITASAAAGLRDLIGLSDGQTVFFRMRSGFATDSWYKVRYSQEAGTAIEKAKRPYLSDVSADGAVEATSYLANRYCVYNNGSSCLTQPGCRASATIWGDEWSAIASSDYETTVRLNRTGDIAWIDQDRWCPTPPYTIMKPKLQGLFDTRTMRLVAPAVGSTLANRAFGRRSITTANNALVRDADGSLAWLAAGGILEEVPTHETPAEAVTDAAGCAIVYNTRDVKEVRWLELCAGRQENRGNDELLGFKGDSLCMSDNGRYLAAIAPESSNLIVYDRVRGAWSDSLIPEPVERITIGGGALYAATRRNSLIRMDLDSGEVVELVPPLPEIELVFAVRTDGAGGCQPCYGTPDPRFLVSDGMYVFLQGRSLNEQGWQVALNGRETPLNGLNDRMASFEFRKEAESGVAAVIHHPVLPAISISVFIIPDARTFACIVTEHEGQDGRPVTFADPARVGETVRIRTAGLDPAKPAPALVDPGAAEVLSFGSDPVVLGMQVLELKIQRPFASYSSLFTANSGNHQCFAPAVQVPR